MKYLLRYGEIGIKSGPVRRRMLARLRDHIALLFRDADADWSVVREEGRLFLESDDPRAPGLLTRAFGLVSFSPVRETTAALEDVVALLVSLASVRRETGSSFAVRVRRVGDHDYTSMDVARAAGTAILEAHEGLEVDLTDPDWTVFAEVRGSRAYGYAEVVEGVGGLSLGSEGIAAALVESPEGAVAAWLLMKRGCYVRPVHRGKARWAEGLLPWDPDLRILEIASLEALGDVAEAHRAEAFVYPWRASAPRPEDLRPAFYPLLGRTKDEMKDLVKRVLAPAED